MTTGHPRGQPGRKPLKYPIFRPILDRCRSIYRGGAFRMPETETDIQATRRRQPSHGGAVAFLVCALLWAAPALAQQLTEGTAAAGINGIVRVQKSQEVQIYSIEVYDANGGINPSVSLGDPGGNTGIQLILSDINASTGFGTGDLTELRLYRSTDATFGGGDTFMASQAVFAPAGAATEIDATGAAAGDRLIPAFPGIFFIVTAVISPTAVDGHAFTVSALINHVGAFEVPPPAGSTTGSPIVASDANHVAIGKPAQPVIGGTLAIPFGGESVMLCLLLGSGAFVLWRRA